jgi:hypothetical protein
MRTMTEPYAPTDPPWWRALERDRATAWAQAHGIRAPLLLAWWKWFARESGRTGTRIVPVDREWLDG